MRIVMVTGEYPPMEGGVGAYTERLAAALDHQGHDLHILTSKASDAQLSQVEAGGGSEPIVHRTARHWGLTGIGRVRDAVRALAPDVVNIQYEPAAYAMKAGIHVLPRLLGSQARTVVTFHDLLPPYLFPKAGPLRAWSVAQLARSASGIVVTNREDEEALREMLRPEERHRGASPPIRLIPIGSNVAAQLPPDFNRDRWRARYGLDHDDLVVAFFGFMNRSKGVETLVEAVAQINHPQMGLAERTGRPVHLLFIGGRTGASDVTNERYADEIDALMDAHHLTPYVHRTGYADAPEVSAAFYAADMCALPYAEGANLRHGTLHAALAHGCPIITTLPSAPLPELQHEAQALLVPPQDPDALAQAVLTLSQDPVLRQRLGTAARVLARHFEWPQIAAEVMAFIECLP